MEELRAEIKSLQNGRYQVECILGAGGFGITYRAIRRADGAVCAIKEYMPEAIASRDGGSGCILPHEDKKHAFLHGRMRFLEEADILMKMSGIPDVVHVWEAFQENNTAYYVMEFLQGTTLKQLMRAMGGRLPYSAAVEAVVKAGNALDRVHRQAGIFHRDISPENIMVMPDGGIKIIDFGSAKSMSVSENQQFSVVLKPGFAPPEQYASNLSQGSFTDVYAMAGTFYYAASGKMIPVAPDRLMGAAYDPLDKLVPECSRKAAEAVDRALLLDPKFRTQTMWEFVQAIAEDMPVIAQVPLAAGERSAAEQRSAAKEWSAAEARVAGAGRTAEAGTKPPGVGGPVPWLEVKKGACAGMRVSFEPGHPVAVGRVGAKSQIVLSGHPEISGLHFKLLYAPEKQGFYVIDESVNGLYYQGIRLDKGRKYKVLPGDELGVGSMQCVITVGVTE